jgi:pantoate--beta-alanine ligase
MLELTNISDLRRWSRNQRDSGRRIGLVPTMGYLHEGHLALVDEARRRADSVVMTIFVNPLQFGPTEDLARYPRNLPRDQGLASKRGVDLLFVPSVEAMYPAGSEVRVVPGPSAERWEGAARPGHFAGVLTVVAKLFHLVEPDLACFGRKDIQQLSLIKRMVRDLDWPLEIIEVPTVREADGLALSSRNAYLSPEQRTQAVGLSRALGQAHRAWCEGERRATAIEERIRQELRSYPGVAVEYIAVAEPEALAPVSTVDGRTIVAMAARVGSTRLIDNINLAQGLG